MRNNHLCRLSIFALLVFAGVSFFHLASRMSATFPMPLPTVGQLTGPLLNRIVYLEDRYRSIDNNILLLTDRLELASNLQHNIRRTNVSTIEPVSTYPIVDGIIDPRKFQYLINPSDICKNANFSMFIYIHTAAVNFERRHVLRKTWANKKLLKRLNMGVVFITGKVTNDTNVMDKIVKESRTYRDIVQTAYVDTYQNISLKSTSSLNWAATYCAPYVPVILKSDDDIFVNITRLATYIRIDLPKIISGKGNKLILCNVWEHEAVIREQFDRWYIPEELYANKEYPPFCQGSALIITSEAAVRMRRALIGARFYPLDDVLLTGFTAPVAGVTLVPINSRHLKSLKERNITKKDLDSNFMFVHTTLTNLLKLWQYMPKKT